MRGQGTIPGVPRSAPPGLSQPEGEMGASHFYLHSESRLKFIFYLNNAGFGGHKSSGAGSKFPLASIPPEWVLGGKLGKLEKNVPFTWEKSASCTKAQPQGLKAGRIL